MYYTRRLQITHDKEICDILSQESGRLYSKTVKFFWRTVRKKDIWLKPSHLMRLFSSNRMHAHSADASVQQFFNALSSWREVRKTVPTAKPPSKLKQYCAVVWKSSTIKNKWGKLILSNGKIIKPLIIDWKYDLTPVLVTLRWHGTGYELIFCYAQDTPENNYTPEVPVGIDLGQIHIAATSEGTILNGRLLRSVRQGKQRSCSILDDRIKQRKEGSKRCKKLINAKRKLCKKTTYKSREILHKLTTGLVIYLKNKGYNTLVVGDLTGYRVDNNCGSIRNQENHSWMYALISWYLKYKWESFGLKYVAQEESYTSKTCPSCGNQKKPTGRNYKCKCGFVGHRDLVGATNILRKYLGTFKDFPVDGLMARPIGVRYKPHFYVAQGFKI